MKQSWMARFGIVFAAVALLFAFGPAAADDHEHDKNRQDSRHGNDDDDLRGLKERVRRLEGNLTQAEVRGGYALLLYQTSLGEGPAGNTSFVEHAVSGGTLQLNANGTLLYSGRELKFTSGWTMPAERQETDRPDGFAGTWQYAGGVLTVTVGAETLRFPGGVGGRFFVTVGANGADGSTTLILLVKNL